MRKSKPNAGAIRACASDSRSRAKQRDARTRIMVHCGPQEGCEAPELRSRLLLRPRGCRRAKTFGPPLRASLAERPRRARTRQRRLQPPQRQRGPGPCGEVAASGGECRTATLRLPSAAPPWLCSGLSGDRRGNRGSPKLVRAEVEHAKPSPAVLDRAAWRPLSTLSWAPGGCAPSRADRLRAQAFCHGERVSAGGGATATACFRGLPSARRIVRRPCHRAARRRNGRSLPVWL